MAYTTRSYGDRALTHPTAVGRRLLSIMAAKHSNLCLSADLTSAPAILSLIDGMSPAPSTHPD